jgi:methionyl aminopeptidase
MIWVKNPQQIEELAKAASIVAECHQIAREMVKPGATTAEINEAVERHIEKEGVTPAFKGYPAGSPGVPDFPAACCMSVDEQVVHGIPNDTPLVEGQILSVDIGVKTKSGWYGDAARTFPVGQIADNVQELLDATQKSLMEAIKVMKPGNYVGDIGEAVQNTVEPRGFSVVRDLVGHGIGQNLHEEPQIPNYGRGGRGLKLREGMVLCVEPMINLGTYRVKMLNDGWTVVTEDGLPSAHFEHQIAITAKGPRVLSLDPT